MRNKWITKKLGDVCEMINRGVSPKYTESTGLCVLNQKCIREHSINFDLARTHDDQVKKVNIEKLVRVGDVLVNSTGTGTLGRVAQVKNLPVEATVDSHITIVRPIKQFFNYDFFGYALVFIENEIAKRGEGCGGQTELARETLKNDFHISFPVSLQEQKQIVSILDNALAAIEKAKENAEQNLKNAKDLFENFLQDVFENNEKRWDEKSFESVCSLIGGSQPSKNNFMYTPTDGYIRLIQVRDYRTDKFTTYIPISKAKRFCTENDIMIGRYGPPIFGIFKGLAGAYNVALMKAEVNTKLCNPNYFYWFLKNKKLREFVEKSSKRAAGQDGVRRELLDKYPVPVPVISEQITIITKLETILEKTKQLEILFQRKIKGLDELKKSILQKAFTGELTKEEVAI